MALILPGKTRCAICDVVLDDDADLVSTSHFIAERGHRLWSFSDAAMHRRCFLAWEHRAEFIELYNNTVGTQIWGDGTRHHMHPDGSILHVSA
jgi:hypothetical protein